MKNQYDGAFKVELPTFNEQLSIENFLHLLLEVESVFNYGRGRGDVCCLKIRNKCFGTEGTASGDLYKDRDATNLIMNTLFL